MSIPDEIVIYKGNACEKRTDFIWGRQIDDEVCDNLLEFGITKDFYLLYQVKCIVKVIQQ